MYITYDSRRLKENPYGTGYVIVTEIFNKVKEMKITKFLSNKVKPFNKYE